MRMKWIGKGILAVLAMLVFVTLGGQVVLHLWNWLLLGLFGFRMITFWQALGILALCRVLFGGFGGCHHRSNFRRRMGERWEKMTPEERKKFRQGMGGRCGGIGGRAESKG